MKPKNKEKENPDIFDLYLGPEHFLDTEQYDRYLENPASMEFFDLPEGP